MIVRLVCRAEKSFPPSPIPVEYVDEFLSDERIKFKRDHMSVLLTRLQGSGVVAIFECEWVFEVLEDGGWGE